MTAIVDVPAEQSSQTYGGHVPNSAKFWDKTAEKYSKSPIKNIEAYNQTMDRAKAHLSKEDSVLEIGCGTGSTALLLADSVKHITATDFSSKMIQIAQSKVTDQGVGNVNFVHATLFDDMLKPGSFDVITAFNILHLMEDLPAVMGRINELLKPGGLLISKTPCLAAQTRLWTIPLYILGKLRVLPYVNCLQFDKLESTISGAGFQLTETGQYPASSMSRFVVAQKV